MAFKKAVKRDAKLRFAICGPAGSGKTFTLLKLATALVGPAGKVAFVDTEHGSASKYAHTDACGGAGACTAPDHFDFDVVEPTNYDPRELIGFIKTAVEQGYGAICGDSLSHYWTGVGGELEQVDKKAAQTKGNSFAAWKSVTPLHNQLVDTMLTAQIHVMVSMRTKTEWVIEKDANGKSTPRKIGLAPIMRDGIEFEFDVVGDMDQDNKLAITKSRCSALSGAVIDRPGAEMAEKLREWLAGAPAEASHRDGVPEELLSTFEAMAKPQPQGRIAFDEKRQELRGRMDGAGCGSEWERLSAAYDGGTPTKGGARALLLDMVAVLAEAESKVGA